jgi:serine/threonine protein phosphatase PrpC
MQVDTALKAGGYSHPGLLRDVNEDRYLCDAARRLLIVVDGMGGQVAGEKAAEIAVTTLRARLERDTGDPAARVREAITLANNEIYQAAAPSAEWRGMACVLTVAVVANGEVVVGHVGDTRLYKLRAGRIEKLTRDHSPVGEREDAGELTEREAMHHPRRNEVYRDVGSEPRQPHDLNFIDVFKVPFEADAALLLCSDGLTDAITTASIVDIVRAYAGHPAEVARALVFAANEAGGKDNVTVVYAEGPRFDMGEDTRDLRPHRGTAPPQLPDTLHDVERAVMSRSGLKRRRRPWLTATLVLLLAAASGTALYLQRDRLNLPDLSRWLPLRTDSPNPPDTASIVAVRPGQSIADAIARAVSGSEVVVEPGEYREQIRMKSGVRIVSRVPRGASLRLPAGASEVDAAVVASGVSDAALSGFRIVGDAATPLGAGVIVQDSSVTISDIEILGANAVAVEYSGGSGGSLLAAHLHDNPGVGVAVGAGAAPRLAGNTFERNATGRAGTAMLIVDAGGRPTVTANTFIGTHADSVSVAPNGLLAPLLRDNWFLESPAPAPARPGRGRR